MHQHEQTKVTNRLLMRTYWKLKRSMRSWLEPFALTPAQFQVLSRTNTEGVPLTKIAEAMHTDLSTVNGIVNRLERSGFVSRQRSTSDRRICYVKLTPEGKQVWDEVKPIHVEWLHQCYDALSPEELDTLQTLLRKLASHVASGENT
ncbi:MAG TPA: MarR family transcriptional regulator [Firmicutes bacterium]|nr:MarR family transcriptional regulator [Bacillota bacterium]